MLKSVKRKAYPSDVTDKEWTIIEPFMPPEYEDGVKRKYEYREIINGIFYVLRTGCSWRSLPHDFPPWSSVYGYFRKWKLEGLWEKMNKEIREKLREKLGKNKEPSAVIIDSQSVKTTEKGGSVVMMKVRR
jgi:putative transposase